MMLRTLLLTGGLGVAMVAFAAPGTAQASHECAGGKPTAASYTWNFKGEANTIFEDIRFEAQHALDHADHLQGLTLNSDLTREAHAEQLTALKAEINDMGAKLCRLETIRRVVAPWQQKEIDRIATSVRLMADNAEDAILFINAHPEEMWMPVYKKYTDNLFEQAQSLSRSATDAVTYAKVRKEDRDLRQKLGGQSAS